MIEIAPADMISAARMKKGTASSGKLSRPVNISLTTTTSGYCPPMMTAAKAARASAKATGTPSSIRIRKAAIRISTTGSLVRHGETGPQITRRDQGEMQDHQCEPRRHRGIDPFHRQAQCGGFLDRHPVHIIDAHPDHEGEET